MLVAEWLAAKQPDRTKVTWTVAIAVGLAQVVGGVFPGASRSSAKLLWDALKGGGAGGENWTDLGIAFVISTITAFVAVKWLLGYIRSHRFTVFAVYRIALGAALLLFL